MEQLLTISRKIFTLFITLIMQNKRAHIEYLKNIPQTQKSYCCKNLSHTKYNIEK